MQDAEVFQIRPGEDEKTIDNAVKAWNWLSNNGADRHSLLINLGGGVVTDLGGFVASTYLRGISFINIPTTLMGMADAAIGGKTAVNLAGIKNQAGTFAFPATVYIIPQFLETLEKRHLLSGFAEILKSALIADPVRWKALKKLDLEEFTGTQPNGKVWVGSYFRSPQGQKLHCQNRSVRKKGEKIA